MKFATKIIPLVFMAATLAAMPTYAERGANAGHRGHERAHQAHDRGQNHQKEHMQTVQNERRANHPRRDHDNNPPGRAGGPGTNWENPPGAVGGPGRARIGAIAQHVTPE